MTRVGRCLVCKLAALTVYPLLAQVPTRPVIAFEEDPVQTAAGQTQTAPSVAGTGALPDSPGWTLPSPPPPLPPCPKQAATAPGLFSPHPPSDAKAADGATDGSARRCIQVNPYQRFLNNTSAIPLSAREKGYLALHNYFQPGNLITIVGTAAFTIAADSHTAYGPGWAGWGRNTGYSFSQDATGEFFGTFLIPSLVHEDPHYHREPNASVRRRIFHAISRTAVAQHDDGRMMPNYAVLLTYPISAEISNLYVPGVHGNGPSTVARIATGLATDPVNNIITEFLPDIAKHINIRVIFVQRILNAVVAGNVSGGGSVAGP